MKNEELKLAVLIDADNVPSNMFEALITEIAKLGEVSVKRIYGDFTSPCNARWRDILNQYAIKPISQFAYTSGKNASDSALIIDAMDLLHTHRFDGFCIVSSDSDFTGLAIRIKEEGLKVYGFGEQKTPESFRNACNKFTCLDILKPAEDQKAVPDKTPEVDKSVSVPQEKVKQGENTDAKIPYRLIFKAIENSCDESGYARLSNVGSTLLRIKPDFDVRLYKHGNSSLSTLFKNRPDLFLMRGSQGTLAVKIKPQRK